MMLFRQFVLVVAAGLALAGCGSDVAVKGLPKGDTLGAADPVKVTVRADYRLSPEDVVQIEVFEVPNLNRIVQLDAQGAISLPLIGVVQAGGKTASELGIELQNRYAVTYLKNPQISVLVKQFRTETVVVDGSVTQPGVFPLQENMSLIKAIAMAKGTDTLANPRQVIVFRMVNNQRVAGVFDLTEIRAGKAVDPPIFANDTIVVAGSGTRKTLRDILGLTPLVSLLPMVVP
jgi:polysaccharide export outer membrane protein